MQKLEINDFYLAIKRFVPYSRSTKIGPVFKSRHQRMMKVMGKHATLKQYHNLIRALHRHGISVYGSFVLNIPDETKQSLRDRVAFIEMSESVEDLSAVCQKTIVSACQKEWFFKDE